ncbi:Cupredoxin [Zychaea mexicana]|uniref:Cupredoxin n=1 Tax=Zychaea mexicana TaxID=64656 RepID=UPI0022FE40B7|nr:Cupredoxin [Zychaea mexicana]KAI9491895.1 Cupredoxin [Zychaea mexicana]
MWPYYLLLLCIISTSSVVVATVREIEIDLSVGVVNPDCYTEGYEVLLVNGQHPAPPIRVTKGDEVRITVRNAEDSNRETTIHYHGIFQIGTVEADGLPYVTQAPIPPGGTFQQNFRVIDQTGTYFYHAHSSLQDDAIHGPFIVYETDEDWPSSDDDDNDDVYFSYKKLREGPYEYDDERVLFFSEWWHQDQSDRLDYLLGTNYKGLTQSHSKLINGRTVYDPTILQDDVDDCDGYSVINVEPGKEYRLRIIGSTTFSTLGFSIAHHMLTIIEVDGELIEPYDTDFVQVAPGQRFSALLRADQPPESYYIATKSYFTGDPNSNALAILRYNNDRYEKRGYTGDSGKQQANKPTIFEPCSTSQALVRDMPYLPDEEDAHPRGWLFPDFRPVSPVDHDFYSPPDRTIVLTPVEQEMPDGTTRWIINNHMPPHWRPSLLENLQHMNHRTVNRTAVDMNWHGYSDGYDEGHQTYPLEVGEVVDFVIQSTILSGNNKACAAHPWHTHGMVHYALANGIGEYIHELDCDIRTYSTPIAQDTTLVYPAPRIGLPSGSPCSWVKIRLLVTNPGLWGFHCHITSHMLQGMMTVLEVSPERIPILQ